MLALFLALAAAPELRLEAVRESLTGVHCRSRVYVDSLPTDEVVVHRCDAAQRSAAQVSAPHGTQPHDRWWNGRRVRRTIVYESPIEPWAVDTDPATGAILRRVPLFFNATKPARVFEVNPVVAMNDPSLQDRNDAASAVPPRAYADVQLPDVAESGPLRGPHAQLVDRQAPSIAPPDAAASLLFDREQDGFEDVHAYFHIDRSQRRVQSLGYRGSRAIAPYAIEIDAHAVSGADNSHFLPSFVEPGRGTLYFGEGGTDDAEDADIVVHEYGHALLEWIAPGAFGGATTSEGRALAEGFCDYWAFSAHRAARAASGRDPYCFADWDARCWEDDPSQRCTYPPGSDCLRRLDSPLTYADYDRTERSGIEHRNGTIWSSALREIHEAVGRDAADTIILEAAFGVPSPATFAGVARLLLHADQLLYGGRHAPAICAAMTRRGILSDCHEEWRGELTVFQSPDHRVAIPDLATVTSELVIADARPLRRVLVRVDLVHGARGDLRIELIAPNGTIVLLQTPSIDRGTALHVTYGLTAMPVESLDVLRGMRAAGTWRLRIRDERSRDAGTLLAWGLQLQFEGDARVDVRPSSAIRQMIPVVGHVYGANDTEYRSEVRIANAAAQPVEATLIFTPSSRDGTTSFSAVKLGLAAGQTVALDDVVTRVFATSGSGSLEILGDVIAMSRTTTMRGGGSVGQEIPPNLETTSLGEPALIVASTGDSATRVNLGLVETRGLRSVVRAGSQDLVLPPYGHLQFRVPHGVYEINAASDVAAYLSEVNDATGDALFIAAQKEIARVGLAPAIAQEGADRAWRSDLWLGGVLFERYGLTIEAIAAGTVHEAIVATPAQFGIVRYDGLLESVFHRATSLAALRVPLDRGLFAATRIAGGGVTQFVPLLDPHGRATQHLVFIDSVAPERTNLGIAAESAAAAEVTLFDAAGREVERFTLATPGGVAQRAVAHAVSNGRATVRFLSGSGRAYASRVDGRTGDAAFVAGQ